MNSKGFTLIELIVTIALLSIIAVISFVSINGIMTKSKVNDCESLVKNIKSAVKEYASDNRYEGILEHITGEDLLGGKYLTSPIIDPFTNKEIDASRIEIDIEFNDDYTVKNIEIKAPLILNDCENGI